MSAYPTTPTDVRLDAGDTWEFGARIPANAVASVTLTSPTGAVTNPVPAGATDLTVHALLTEPGRYLAVLTSVGATTDVIPFTAWADDPTAAVPGLTQIRAYLDTNGESSQTDEAILEALAAEEQNQRDMCYVDDYGPALAEALKRRVAKNLAARAVPIASVTTFDGGSTQARVQRYDAEVTRFEGPYRRVVVG
jgi:hypothetical protein